MALTTRQEAKIALLLEAFDGAKSIGDLPVADSATLLTALMEVVQGGQYTGELTQPTRQERPTQQLQIQRYNN